MCHVHFLSCITFTWMPGFAIQFEFSCNIPGDCEITTNNPAQQLFGCILKLRLHKPLTSLEQVTNHSTCYTVQVVEFHCHFNSLSTLRVRSKKLWHTVSQQKWPSAGRVLRAHTGRVFKSIRSVQSSVHCS